MKKSFTKYLLQWYRPDQRKMPWKGSKDPYIVWLSEIILQQTRVEQGLPYFIRFKDKYPSILQLAKAKEDEVLKLWEGLGYYSRARNMLTTAKLIVEKLDGNFPQSYNELIKLKGVGAYTAAAILSFAFNQTHAVVDGNVFRVLSRYFGIKKSIDDSDGKKYFTRLANELIDKKNPARFNQAIMEFGAGHCKPINPLCDSCLLKINCVAFNTGAIQKFPVKSKKIKSRIRYFNYLVARKGDSILLQQRQGSDIWKKLYEFPLIETKREITFQKIDKLKEIMKIFQDGRYLLSPNYIRYEQRLTHQKIIAKFWEIKTNSINLLNKRKFIIADKKSIKEFAFPKLIFCYLKDISYI